MTNDESVTSSGDNANTALAAVRNVLKEKSNDAIKRGNEFNGFFGFTPEQYSKEDLILLLNILFDKIQTLRLTQAEYEKRLIV